MKSIVPDYFHFLNEVDGHQQASDNIGEKSGREWERFREQKMVFPSNSEDLIEYNK
jgi:hypothetical protein